MKLFSLLQLKYNEFTSAVQNYLAKALGNVSFRNSSSSIFGQIINVVQATTQNILSYIEDSLTEQNKYTATRKRSIYNLASISGYQPHMGSATTATISLAFKPNNAVVGDVILPNRTKFSCSQNGCTFNLILPQEAIVLSPRMDNSTKFLTVVEGKFESQTFMATGGELYTINVPFSGDCDIEYLEVEVNNEKWERRESLYDLDPEAKQYFARTALKKGVDLIFGNGQYGKALHDQDNVKVTYLLHSGEYGNINSNEPVSFEFSSSLRDVLGGDVDGNSMFSVQVYGKEFIRSGSFSEDTNQVREMIGLNSRSLVLADPKNYSLALNRFSFVGYNRTWSEPGSLVINSLVLANFKTKLADGLDYFNLTERDFYLSDDQKQSIINSIRNSGQQLAGAVYNIFDAEVCKYAIYVYVKLKSESADTQYITNQIRKLLGGFFADIKSDIFIPKSDITKLLKDNIDEIDGVNIYFLSDRNEQALKNHKYIDKQYNYNPSKGTYDIKETLVYLYGNENPNLGLDSHGNIYLDNTDQFPVLMGGWSFISSAAGERTEMATVIDPVTIIYE